MMKKNKIGRPALPYETKVIRIPAPLHDKIIKLIEEFKAKQVKAVRK
jgi:hypothetical protein